MLKFSCIILSTILLLTATACGPVLIEPATTTPTPTETLVPTATIDWFPVTATSTRVPTQIPIPTADWRPGIDGLIFEDHFEEPDLWSLIDTENTRVSILNNRLGLVNSLESRYLFTTRTEPLLTDFYFEITAEPSLCSGMAEYGIMLRVTGNLDYVRLALRCDGYVRVERIYQGGVNVLVPWTEIRFVPSTAPSSVRIGVWALGSDIRFFIEDHYLFSVREPYLYQGTLGVYVRTIGDDPVSASFRDIFVYSVSP